MQIWISRIIVAACAFATGLAVVALVHIAGDLKEQPPAFTQVCVLPAPSYCELVKNPDCYDGQIVRVRTKLDFDDHGFFFHDDACAMEQNQAAGRLDEISREDFDRLLSKACGGQCDSPLDVVVSGRFEKVIPSGQTNLLWDNLPLHLGVMRLDKVSRAR